MNESIFSSHSYRVYLASVIQAGEWGLVTRLAEAANCQRSYLSQVIREKAHLSVDQLLPIARFLQLNDAETDFLLLLADYEKAATELARSHIQKRLQSLRNANSRVGQVVGQQKKLDPELLQHYYSDWTFEAIHIGTSSKNLQTVESLAKHLNLDKAVVEKVLHLLANSGLVKKSAGGRWEFSSGNLHLPGDSPLSTAHHLSWRVRAVTASRKTDRNVHYTSVFTIDEKDLAALQTLLAHHISKGRKLVQSSGTEKLVCWNIDLFEV